jgi:rhamnosyltransferase
VANLYHEPSVVAVIVSFNPRGDEISALVDAIVPQVDHVLIVDNGSKNNIAGLLPLVSENKLTILELGANLGVATAINHGIAWAKEHFFSHAILFDQDSMPAHNMVSILLHEFMQLQAEGVKCAAVGPNYSDPRAKNRPPFIRIRGLRIIRMYRMQTEKTVEVDYLISSGCLISIEIFDHIGFMIDDLFIDYVDIEWGLRARSKGFRMFGAYDAHMKHTLGESPLKIAGHLLPVHSPMRHYYHFRNAVWLCQQSWIPLNWRVVNTYRLVCKVIVYSLFAEPQKLHFRMICNGIRDGLSGRLGQLVQIS